MAKPMQNHAWGEKKKQETQMHNVGTNELKVCPWLSDDLQNCYFRALQVTVFNWAGLRVDFKCQNVCL